MHNNTRRNEKMFNSYHDDVINEESESEREERILSAAQRLKFKKGNLTPKYAKAMRLKTPHITRESKQKSVYTFGQKSSKANMDSLRSFSEEPDSQLSRDNRKNKKNRRRERTPVRDEPTDDEVDEDQYE